MEGGRVLRIVNERGAADLAEFLASAAIRQLTEAGRVIATRALPAEEGSAGDLALGPDDRLLEHERVPFPSYPYEWPAEMLHSAGHATLDVAEALLPEGLGLKDATPYNVLFRGARPVFVDVLSVERREPRDPIWLPHAQFLRTFALPLLVARDLGVPLRGVFEMARDGLRPEDVYRLTGPLQRLRPPFLGTVTLPTWLGRRRGAESPETYRQRLAPTPERARFILGFLLRRLRRLLDRVAPRVERRSAWTDYATGAGERTPEFAAKRDLVREIMAEFHPKSVLDVGCNTGYLAAEAARAGARVVAIDSDPHVVGLAWRRADAEQLDLLPLVVDLTRPSPAQGWRNQECPSFLERARAAGGFDATFLFAVLHHMLVTERVPLGEVLDLVADLTGRLAVVEFVPPDDPFFRRIARGREHLHRDLTAAAFAEAADRRFTVARVVPVAGTSRLVHVLLKR